MSDSGTLTIAAFAVASSLVLLMSMFRSRGRRSLESRLQEAGEGYQNSPDSPRFATTRDLPSGSPAALLMPKDEQRQRRLRDRLIHAGLYKRNSTAVFMTLKLILVGFPVLLGLGASSSGLVTVRQALFFGVLAGGFGTIIPGLWLDYKKRRRQTEIMRALPDALDVIVVCVEGGLSLAGAIARVSTELKTAHRTLAAEMGIVQREIQLGKSTGEALRGFANRFDVEELRSLSSVILQAERFGASIVNALRVHADSLRMKRRQRAEEMAQKASVKLVFPTIFFIFPALFVVIMGPAVFDIIEMFRQMQQRT
ncbi:MAG: type II secretion system F family protein [Planctomycetaceae bacterium]